MASNLTPNLLSSTQTLLNSVRGALKMAVAANYVSEAKADDAYEAYILSLVVQAALAEGATNPPMFQDKWGKSTKSLVLRRGPGDIWGTTRRFTHVVLQFAKSPPYAR